MGKTATAKTIDLSQVVVNSHNLEEAKNFLIELQTSGKVTRVQWSNLGGVLKQAKTSVDGNTKLYGLWLKENFPQLDKYTPSKAVWLNENFHDVNKWANKHKPLLNNPVALYNAFKRYEREQEAKEEAKKEPQDTVEVEETQDAVEVEETPENKTIFGRFEKDFNTLIGSRKFMQDKTKALITELCEKWLEMESNEEESFDAKKYAANTGRA